MFGLENDWVWLSFYRRDRKLDEQCRRFFGVFTAGDATGPTQASPIERDQPAPVAFPRPVV